MLASTMPSGSRLDRRSTITNNEIPSASVGGICYGIICKSANVQLVFSGISYRGGLSLNLKISQIFAKDSENLRFFLYLYGHEL